MPFICKCQKIKSTTRHLNLSYIYIHITVYIHMYINSENSFVLEGMYI